MSNPIIIIEMASGKSMKLELYPDKAPISVDNFIELSESGFYDGLSFHRVVKDYVIQGGSATNTCMNDGCKFVIPGEFSENSHDTGLTHKRGAISMARDDDPDSAGTQFFIVHKDAYKLDGRYAAFGQLIEGLDVLDEIANTETLSPEEENRPIVEQTIKEIKVERNGYQPKEPIRIDVKE